jgi:ABC-type spermidine/putrescine transport system permease subunit I
MGFFAVRTYEPWTIGSALSGLLLLAVLVALVIVALSRRNR